MSGTERYPGQYDPFAPPVPHSLRNLTPPYWNEIRWEAIANQDIEPEVLEVLGFNLSLEGQVGEIALYLHANRVLRRQDLAGEDVARWQVEEAFHEIALHTVLRQHDVNMPDRGTFRRQELSRHDRLGNLRPFGALAVGVFAPRFAKALSVYDGVKGEAMAQATYEMIADLTENDALSYLLHQIALQEAGHGHMFQAWGQSNPVDETVQRRVRTTALHSPIVTVGEGFQPPGKICRVLEILSAHPHFKEKMLGVDRRIDTLPGLADMHIIERRILQP